SSDQRLPTWSTMTPPMAAPPTVPSTLPPEMAAPATPPSPAPVTVAFWRRLILSQLEHPAKAMVSTAIPLRRTQLRILIVTAPWLLNDGAHHNPELARQRFQNPIKP